MNAFQLRFLCFPPFFAFPEFPTLSVSAAASPYPPLVFAPQASLWYRVSFHVEVIVWLPGNMISPRQERPDAFGGGWSERENWSYGFSSIQGKKYTMEDFYEVQITAVGGITVGLFGVFDGHGGSAAADYVRKNLFKNLIEHPQFITDTKSAIVEAYKQTDLEYLSGANGTSKDAGSTASTVILLSDGRLFVANVGDSRVVISRSGKAIPMSTDHKPNSSKERQRIEKAGGAVIWAGAWRVSGILAVSRAFGDRLLKRFVVAEPDLKEETINDEHEFIVLASDGVWDVITNQDAVSLIHSIPSAEDAAKRLTEEAFRRGSFDNITCIVIHFHKNAI